MPAFCTFPANRHASVHCAQERRLRTDPPRAPPHAPLNGTVPYRRQTFRRTGDAASDRRKRHISPAYNRPRISEQIERIRLPGSSPPPRRDGKPAVRYNAAQSDRPRFRRSIARESACRPLQSGTNPTGGGRSAPDLQNRQNTTTFNARITYRQITRANRIRNPAAPPSDSKIRHAPRAAERAAGYSEPVSKGLTTAKNI